MHNIMAILIVVNGFIAILNTIAIRSIRRRQPLFGNHAISNIHNNTTTHDKHNTNYHKESNTTTSNHDHTHKK